MPMSDKIADLYEPVPIIFSDKLKRAHQILSEKSAVVGPIQDDGSHKYFEIRDPEGRTIEVCTSD